MTTENIENYDLIPLSDAVAEIGAQCGGDNLPSMSAIYGRANTGRFPCIRRGVGGTSVGPTCL